jgi:uncharacterized protein YukE
MPDKNAAGDLDQIAKDILAGDPDKMVSFAWQFGQALARYKQVREEIPVEAQKLAAVWKGAAATGFDEVSKEVVASVEETEEALDNPRYNLAINSMTNALRTGQAQIKELVGERDGYLDGGYKVNGPAFDKAGRDIADAISVVYKSEVDSLKVIKGKPEDPSAEPDAEAEPKPKGEQEFPDENAEKNPGETDPGKEPGGPNLVAEPDGVGGPDGVGDEFGEPGPDSAEPGDLDFDPAKNPTLDSLTLDPGDEREEGENSPILGIGNPQLPLSRFVDSEPLSEHRPSSEVLGIGDPDSNESLIFDDDTPTKLASTESPPIGPSRAGEGPDFATKLTSQPNAQGHMVTGEPSPQGSRFSGGAPFGPGLSPFGAGNRSVGDSPRSKLTSARGPRSGPAIGAPAAHLGVGKPGSGYVPYLPVGASRQDADEAAERETWLLGDEEWVDGDALDGPIGRPEHVRDEGP